MYLVISRWSLRRGPRGRLKNAQSNSKIKQKTPHSKKKVQIG